MQVGCEKDIAQAPRCHAVYCDAFGGIDFFFTALYPSLFRLLTLLVLPSFSQTLSWSEMLWSFIETCFIFLLLCVCFAVAVSCFHSNISLLFITFCHVHHSTHTTSGSSTGRSQETLDGLEGCCIHVLCCHAALISLFLNYSHDWASVFDKRFRWFRTLKRVTASVKTGKT